METSRSIKVPGLRKLVAARITELEAELRRHDSVKFYCPRATEDMLELNQSILKRIDRKNGMEFKE